MASPPRPKALSNPDKANVAFPPGQVPTHGAATAEMKRLLAARGVRLPQPRFVAMPTLMSFSRHDRCPRMRRPLRR